MRVGRLLLRTAWSDQRRSRHREDGTAAWTHRLARGGRPHPLGALGPGRPGSLGLTGAHRRSPWDVSEGETSGGRQVGARHERCTTAGAWPSCGALGHADQARPPLLICREPKLGDRAQAGLLDQVHEMFRPPLVRGPANGHTSIGLGAHRVFVADVCSGDEVAAWLQGAREQGQDLRKDVARKVEQSPPPGYAAQGRFFKAEVGGRGDTEAASRMRRRAFSITRGERSTPDTSSPRSAR